MGSIAWADRRNPVAPVAPVPLKPPSPVTGAHAGAALGRSVMHYHTERSREYFQQAEECARQANAQMDPKVRRQFLVLAQLWLILAELFELKSEPAAVEARGRGTVGRFP